jgi:hypothetical protein
MAFGKIRALHPDFFIDDDLCEVSIPARLMFAGLWCFACDNGHLPDRPKQIKRWIYATDDLSAADLLRELEDIGVIERDGTWITVNGLAKRQRIDWRYFKTCDFLGCEKPKKPDPERKTLRGNAGTRSAPAETTRGPATDGDGDGDSDGDRKTTASSVANAPSMKPTPRRATQRPDDFRPTQAHADLAAERGVDLHAEWAKFCDWCDANGKTYKDWPAALRNWIRNARPTSAPSQQRSRVDDHLDLAARLRSQQLEIGETG